MDEDCTQPLSSDPLEYHDFFLRVVFPFVRNLHKLEPLTLIKLITTQSTRVRERNTHKTRIVSDLEIGKRICFVKINQVVAKVIQICQIER
jgi:hypothetical protein